MRLRGVAYLFYFLMILCPREPNPLLSIWNQNLSEIVLLQMCKYENDL